MNDDSRFSQLWNDYLEGELGEAEVEELRRLMNSNPIDSSTAVETYQTHRLLGYVSRDSDQQRNAFVEATMAKLPSDDEKFVDSVMDKIPSQDSATRGSVDEESIQRANSWRLSAFTPWLIAIAASLLVIVSGALLYREGEQHTIARITQVHGAAQWIGTEGTLEVLTTGRSVAGGTLESLTPDSWIELRFDDGSELAISGRSMLTISAQDQKVLNLRHGDLSARVAPQPAGNPMLLNTPTAELMVLGTQFNVDVDASRTVLAVKEGRVSVQKLTGGPPVEVPAEHLLVASLEQESEFKVTSRERVVHSWVSDLAADVAHGKKLTRLDSLGARLKSAVRTGEMSEERAIAEYKSAAILDDPQNVVWAIPFVVKKWASPEAADVVRTICLSVPGRQSDQVLLNPDAMFLVRGSISAPHPVEFGINTTDGTYGKSGKYSVVRSIRPTGEDDEFEIELPLAEFRLNIGMKGASDSPVDAELTGWWCTTTGDSVALAITHVELLE